MARLSFWAVLALVAPVAAALAEPPVTSPRPMPRPAAEGQPAPIVAAETPSDLLSSLRPRPRPDVVETQPQKAAAPAQSTAKTPASAKGSVCKNPAIKGVTLKPITSRTKGCGIKAPVQVTSVNGVKLNPPAVLNCEAAQALSTWVENGLQPAFKGQVVQLNVADSYSCRPRNNVRGNKISEHGKGNAIDIEAFVLASGKVLTVLRNYGTQIKAAKKAACGTFHTTLGPGSDGYHENHIHLDIAKNGPRPYCR